MLLALGIGLVIAGCGSSGPVDKGEVTLTVRPEGIAEKRLLDQIYAQALRAAGYKVKEAPPQTRRMTAFEELRSSRIAGFPEYLSTALYQYFDVEEEDLPGSVVAAYEEAKKGFEGKELTAFRPTPYGIANGVGMLRKAAERRGLRTDSDLKGQAEEMTLKAPTYCHLSLDCLGGIELHYGTGFESVTYEKFPTSAFDWWTANPIHRYEVLEDGEANASILFTTEGRLATERGKFVVLEDDKHALPAANVVWVTSPEVVDEAGPGYEKAILAAQKGLTLGVMRRLNAKMELGRKQPAKVAAEYLKSIHYSG